MWQSKKLEKFYEEDQNPDLKTIKTEQVRLAKITKVYPDKIEVSLDKYITEIKLPDPLPYYNPEQIIKEGELIDVVVKSFDPEQDLIELEMSDKTRIQGAVVILDVHTGDILGMMGGENFFDRNNDGMWNRATQGRRQPGSGFKPFFFATAFESGFTLATIFNDEPITFSDGYAPKNYENKFFGPTTLQEALEHSRNVVTIKLFLALGMKNALKFVKKFHLSELGGEWEFPQDPTVCLGNVLVTPLELADAYIPFANQGIGVVPNCLKSVTDLQGKELKEYKPKERVVLSPESAYLITYALMGAIERGTAAETIGEYFSNKKKMPQIAGKTGTTNDCIDAWFIGYTPDLVIAVFVGFDQNRTLGPKMTGSRVAGPIWNKIVDRILAANTSLKEKKFKSPANIVYQNICSSTGLIASERCKNSGVLVYSNMPFKKGTEPTHQCTAPH